MNAQFELLQVPETAWERRIRLVVEILDAVTGAPIRNGLEIRVAGLAGAPVLGLGGAYVWHREDGATPTEVAVSPGRLPFVPRTEPVPLPNMPPQPGREQYSLMQLELAPTMAYPFGSDTTGIRGTLVRQRNDDPPVPVHLAYPAEDLQLQWLDDSQVPPAWSNTGIAATTDANGDFAAIIRLGPSQLAATDSQGRLRVRTVVRFAGATRYSPELPIRFGSVADVPQSFAWNEFTNT